MKKFAMAKGSFRPVIGVILFWMLFLVLWMAPLFSGLLPQAANLRMWENGVSGCIAAFLTTAIFLRVERRSFRDIGLVWERGTLGRFFLGIGIGAALFGLIQLLAAAWLGAWPRPQPIDRERVAGIFILLFLSLAEEVGFRAYPLVRLQSFVGLRVSQWVVAVAFAVFHMAYGWNMWVAFTGPLVWSFVFSLAAIRWRGIAVPVGLHLAINVLQGLFLPTGGRNTPPGQASLLVQALLFVVALLLTEGFVRRERKVLPK